MMVATSDACHKQAVKSLWYSMKRGEVFCLLGENGAGKTTSINVLTGATECTFDDACFCHYHIRRIADAVSIGWSGRDVYMMSATITPAGCMIAGLLHHQCACLNE